MARRAASSASHSSAPARSMKFMLLPMTSKCFCGRGWLRSACRMSATCWVAPKYTSPSIRSSLSCGHSGKKAPTLVASCTTLPPEGAGLAWGGSALRPASSAGCCASSITTNCRSGARLSKPMVRMAGREVRYRKDISDSSMPSKIAISSRMVTVATGVATVTIRLEIAILLGMLLSLMSFLYRTSRPAMRTMGFDSRAPDRQFVVIDDAQHPADEAGRSAGPPQARPAPSGGSVVHEVTSVGAFLPECPQLKLLRMEGEVYFGATQHVADILHAPVSYTHLRAH